MANPETQRFVGLTQAEAAHRLKTIGYNELPTSNRRRMWQIAFGVLREPMFLPLFASGLIYLVPGEATRIPGREVAPDNIHVRGYSEEGGATTSFRMRMLNDSDRPVGQSMEVVRV